MEINRVKGNVVIYVEPIQLRTLAVSMRCSGFDGGRDSGPGKATFARAAAESCCHNETRFGYDAGGEAVSIAFAGADASSVGESIAA